MEVVRKHLEAQVSGHPDEADLVARLRSGDNTQFRSAVFELSLYAALRELGYDVQCHPELPNGLPFRPDFFATAPSGRSFYLEAVLASENTGDPGGHPLIATTLDVFTKAAHPNFTVMVKPHGAPTTQPSRKRLRRETLRWLDALDPNEVGASIKSKGWASAPQLEWVHEGLKLTLTAMPLREDRRGKASRLLGAQFGQASWVNTSSPLRAAVEFKGRRYGQLEAPLVVAINVANRHMDRDDEMQALFGDEQFVVSVSDSDAEAQVVRKPNGAWLGPAGPRLTRVTAAWIFSNLCPYNLATVRGTLYLNPWSRYSIPDDLRTFAHAEDDDQDGEIVWRDGRTLGEALGLPARWPEQS